MYLCTCALFARPSNRNRLRTCHFWRPQGRDNSRRGGEGRRERSREKHRNTESSCALWTSDSWEAGSSKQACEAPRPLFSRGPYYAPTRSRARAHTHMAIYIRSGLDKERDEIAPLLSNLPANSYIHARANIYARVYRSNCATELVRFPVSNERARRRRRRRWPVASLYLSTPLLFSGTRREFHDRADRREDRSDPIARPSYVILG